MKTTLLVLAMAVGAGTIEAAQNNNSSPVKLDTIGITVESDIQIMNRFNESRLDITPTDGEAPYCDSDGVKVDLMFQFWDCLNGGFGKSTTTSDSEDYYSGSSHAGDWGMWYFSPWDPFPYDYDNPDYTTYAGQDGWSMNTPLGSEYCDVQNNYNTLTTIFYPFLGGYGDLSVHHTYTRFAQTTMELLSGGRAIPGRQILHQIQGWAKNVSPPLGIEAYPPYWPVWAGSPTAFGLAPALPNKSVHLLGDTLHDPDGSLYYVTPAGAPPMDCTPVVYGNKFYTWYLVDTPHVHNNFVVFVRMPYPQWPADTWNSGNLFYPYWSGDVMCGHAWWKLTSDAPTDAINQKLKTPDSTKWINMEVGFMPLALLDIWYFSFEDWDSLVSPGIVDLDGFNGDYSVYRIYDIGFTDLIAGLNHTEDFSITPGIWNSRTRNCVHQTQITGNDVGVTLPCGSNDWLPEYFGHDLPPSTP
jgi:hypothetical protein